MSLAAGVLSAALALPQAGLVAAYDFARTNHLNWSEDLTQATWNLTAAWATGTTRTLSGGVSIITVTGTGDGFIWAGINLTGNTAGVRVFMRARVRGSGSVRLNIADTGGAVSANDLATSNLITLTDQWQDLYATGVIAVADRTGIQFRLRGAGPLRLEVERVQGGYGADAPYEKTLDGQTLIDRSVRLWPAPTARTNLLSWSEELSLSPWVLTNATVTSGVADPLGGTRAFTLTGLPITSGTERRLLQTAPPATASERRVNSVYLRRRTGVGAVQMLTPQNSAWIDLALTGAWQRFTTSGVLGSSASLFALRLLTDGDQVDVAFPQQESGTTPLAYERQTDGVVYDFSLKGRNLLANSDLTGSAGSAPTGWAAASAANISYGTDGSVTFTATTRFGAIHQAQQNLPVGGRPFTASMDLATTGGGRLLVYLYDHAGAYLTAMSSTTINGRAVIQVNRTDVYRVQFRIEDERVSGWTPITFRQPMLELGLTDGGYQASARHATLGSSTGPDANDPAWTALGLSFDAADDFIAHRIGLMGPRTFIQVIAPEATTNAFPDWGQIGHTMLYGNAAATAISCNNRRAGGTNAPLNVAVGLTPGRPVFVAVSIQQGRQAAFVNGVRTYVATVSDLQETDPALYYGTNFGKRLVGSEPPKGQQLYAAIYDRALTDAEVHQAYRFIRNQLSIKRGITI